MENGGVEVACSNRHYGEPKNMIKVSLLLRMRYSHRLLEPTSMRSGCTMELLCHGRYFFGQSEAAISFDYVGRDCLSYVTVIASPIIYLPKGRCGARNVGEPMEDGVGREGGRGVACSLHSLMFA